MRPDPEVIAYIKQYPSDLKEIMYRVRSLIEEVVPVVEESIKWKMPTFTYLKKHICYMAGFKKHVTLAFFDGTMLNDPDRKLHGSGKLMKHIKFTSPDDIDEEQLKLWILEGFYT